jgi:hypothetical protein
VIFPKALVILHFNPFFIYFLLCNKV